MSIQNITAVFEKQIKETFKNKEVLIQFVMFPILTVIMENAIKIEGMPRNYFVFLFATMYIGMAPLTSMAAILSEEKEKNTLRVLLMSNVKPAEYLLGVGGYLFFICMLGAAVFGITGKYTGVILVKFLMIMAVGILSSLLIGAAIGTFSRNQMMATSLAVPVMMVFSFLPMLAAFNKNIEQAARITYSQQINVLLGSVEHLQIQSENVIVIAINILAAVILFGYAYRKSGLA